MGEGGKTSYSIIVYVLQKKKKGFLRYITRMNGLIASEDASEDGEVVIIYDTWVVLVDGHH